MHAEYKYRLYGQIDKKDWSYYTYMECCRKKRVYPFQAISLGGLPSCVLFHYEYKKEGLYLMWNDFINAVKSLAADSGFANITLLHIILILISLFFLYLAIAKKYEPLLLVPIAFGMLLANLPLGELMHPELWDVQPLDFNAILHNGGLLDLLYLGVKLGQISGLLSRTRKAFYSAPPHNSAYSEHI